MLLSAFGWLSGRDSAGQGGARAPWRARLKAWWEGYELDEPWPPAEPTASAGDAAELEPAAPAAPPRRPKWMPPELEAVQQVWGEGFCGPGGADEVLALVEVLGLGREMSMLDLGAGLGGPARAMAKEHGVWISGMEPSPELARIGMELSTKAGMSKKVPITTYDPEKLELPPRKYDCVFAKETFYTIANKQRLIDHIRESLKLRAQLLFTDYLLSEPGLDTKVVRDWIVGEPAEAHPWSLVECLEALDERRFERAITPLDMSDDFNSLIVQGWDRCANFIAGEIGAAGLTGW